MENTKSGRVIINRIDCDNTSECSAINVCTVGALLWDARKEQIDYNAEICCDCGKCVDACPVGAILWGKDEEDYWLKHQAIENEKRRLEEVYKELFDERYGASPIDIKPIDFCDIHGYLDSSAATAELVLIEIFSDDSINCLLHSIRVEEVLSWLEGKGRNQYQKAYVSENDHLDGYGIHELPSLMIYKDKKLIGNIEGYYTDAPDSKAMLRKKLLEICSGL